MAKRPTHRQRAIDEIEDQINTLMAEVRGLTRARDYLVTSSMKEAKGPRPPTAVLRPKPEAAS